MATIFYLYDKTDGRFLGSGTARIDNARVGATTRPFDTDIEEEMPVFNPRRQSWTRQKLRAREKPTPTRGTGNE